MDDTNNVQRDKQGHLATDREHLTKLCALNPRQKIKDTRYSFVAEELLQSLCCVQLENIDVDIDHNDCAIAATYFQPSRSIDDGLKQMVTQRHDWDMSPGQAPRLYPELKASWFTGPWREAVYQEEGELRIDRFGGSAWRCFEYV